MLEHQQATQVSAPRPRFDRQVVTAPRTAPPPQQRPLADMKPCRRCGRTHRRRMVALMSAWYAHRAGVFCEGGYFYLCPSCYRRFFGADEGSDHPRPARPVR
jgi:hypothetical protein